jgi:hypothetical protein
MFVSSYIINCINIQPEERIELSSLMYEIKVLTVKLLRLLIHSFYYFLIRSSTKWIKLSILKDYFINLIIICIYVIL